MQDQFVTLILNPAFALVSINITPNSRDLESPSSIETCLFDQPTNNETKRRSAPDIQKL